MAKVNYLKPVYVEFIPSADSIREGELYFSLEFQTAIHKCCCGCGEEVVTPLNPAQWRISINSGKVSLFPSIGNWSYQCQSHYFIKENRIIWAEAFSEEAIKRVQAKDQKALNNYIAQKNAERQTDVGLIQRGIAVIRSFGKKLRDYISRK